MIRKPIGGGGNVASHKQIIIIRRAAAIGDAVCATIVADKLAEQGYEVAFQSQPGIHCVLRRVKSISTVLSPDSTPNINLDNSYEQDPDRRTKHFHQMFMESANVQLRSPWKIDLGKALNCKPRLEVTQPEKEAARSKFESFPKPWIFICPCSNTYRVRQVPDGVWADAVQGFGGTKFWLGLHPPPPGIVDIKCHNLVNLIKWLSVADLLISVDTGPLHIGAALGVPILAISQSSSPDLHLSDQCDFHSIAPDLECLNCQKNMCPISVHIPPCQYIPPDQIIQGTRARLAPPNVSAVVSVYKPEAGVLNRCLNALIPQVGEIVVVRDLAGKFPDDALQHPKIRYIVKNLYDIGYGRKINYGARHTTGRNLLLINDDCFLEPDAVQKMVECMKPGVGMVSNLLFYPNGTIYHAGKVRSPGVRGWSHIDYKKHIPTFQEPTELENCCGCCILVRREAFYQIDGFDEDYWLFAEDDDMALSMRCAGWKIMFTPHSKGIHMEHQSVNKTGNIAELVHKANQTFGRKWSWYLDKNLHTIPGTFV